MLTVVVELLHADGRTYGRTDRYDEAESRLTQLYECA